MGEKALVDPLALFFSQLIDDNGLVDLAPPCAGTTWRMAGQVMMGSVKDLTCSSFLLLWYLLCSDIECGLPLLMYQTTYLFVWSGGAWPRLITILSNSIMPGSWRMIYVSW